MFTVLPERLLTGMWLHL